MAQCACPSGPGIPLSVIDVDDELVVSSPDDADHIIDHLLDATEGIDALSAQSIRTTRRNNDDP